MNGRRLYEEIGGVDERYLQEAAGYRAKRKQAPTWRVLLVAAALLMACVVVLSAVSAGVAIGVIFDALQEETVTPSNPTQDSTVLTPLAQMEQTMQTVEGTLEQQSADELGLLGGNAKLIWSEQGSDVYYSVLLSDYELQNLLGKMQSKNRTEFTEQSAQPQYQVWICLGNGMVVTPYLKNSPGNVCHGKVFDYDPELELSDDLARSIAYYLES